MDKFTELFQQLTMQLGITAEYLWPYLVRRMQIQSILWVAVELLFIVLTPVVIITGIKLWIKCLDSDYDWEGRAAITVSVSGLIGVIWIILAIIALFSIPESLSNMLVPEAAVINDLLKGLKK